MSEVRTKFRKAFIHGVSKRSDNVEELTGDDVDVVIVTSSWDARSISITKSRKMSAKLGIGIFFDTKDKRGLRDRHDPVLLNFLGKVSVRQVLVTGESCDVSVTWTKIQEHLLQVRSELRRPIRIFMDLSACSRYYSLGVAAFGFMQRIASSVTYFYSEAVYTAGSGEGELAFTGGRWATVSIPYLSGLFDPSKRTLYVVSVGFEGEKTFRAVSRADPDRVSLLFTKPGYCRAYEMRARKANANLVKEFVIPKNQVINAPASDAIEAWKRIEEFDIERKGTENRFYMCCGTKPHSLAMALSAMANGTSTVLYSIPDEHRVHETEPNGIFWTYGLHDVTAIV